MNMRSLAFVSPLLSMAAISFGMSIALHACTSASQLRAVELLATKIACAIDNHHLENEQILSRCAVQPGDAERVLAIVGQARSVSANAGACHGEAGGKQ